MKAKLSKEHILEILGRELPYLRDRFGVVSVALYGSFAHGSATDKSDVDLLVALSRPLGLEFVALAEYFEKQLGCRVDLTTFETLNRSLDHPRYGRIARNIQRTLTDVHATAR